jgi:hypothetical protein
VGKGSDDIMGCVLKHSSTVVSLVNSIGGHCNKISCIDTDSVYTRYDDVFISSLNECNSVSS